MMNSKQLSLLAVAVLAAAGMGAGWLSPSPVSNRGPWPPARPLALAIRDTGR